MPVRPRGDPHGVKVADTGAAPTHVVQLILDLPVLGIVLGADPLMGLDVDLRGDDARHHHEPLLELRTDETAGLLIEEAASQGQDEGDGQHEDHHQLGLKAPAPGRGQGKSSLVKVESRFPVYWLLPDPINRGRPNDSDAPLGS
ncbi:hypothetical protein D3C86_960320 [compost metagenome]